MTAMQALIGFTAWTLLLVLLVFAYRGGRFMAGTPINSWPHGAKRADDASLVSASRTPMPTAWKTCRCSR